MPSGVATWREGSQQQFFAAIGHELRTPIAAILGTAELLGSDARELVPPTDRSGLDAPTDGPVAAVAEFASSVAKDSDVVLSAGEQLLAIVDDLLDTGQELGGGTEPVGRRGRRRGGRHALAARARCRATSR